ncbi:MAG: CopD family protein, partial [Halobacteriaceae archaeon]
IFVPLLWLALDRFADTAHTATVAYLRWSLFVVTLLSLVGFAWTETSGRVLAGGVRLGHIGVFALWIGGATWHNFVVLPTVRTSPSVAGGIKSQARRFRRHLPIVIVVVFGTGIYQTIRLLGHSVSALFGTSLGRLITVKIGILLVLTILVAINLRQARRSTHPNG